MGAELDEEFVADEHEGRSYDLIPPGWYVAEITESEMKTTKDGSGQFIAFRFDIREGDQSGRVVFGNVTWKNKSEAAVRIGRADFKAICEAVGVPAARNTAQLHNIALQIKVAISRGRDGYEDRNEVKGYKPYANPAGPGGAGARAATASTTQARASAPQKAAGGAPWGKRA